MHDIVYFVCKLPSVNKLNQRNSLKPPSSPPPQHTLFSHYFFSIKSLMIFQFGHSHKHTGILWHRFIMVSGQDLESSWRQFLFCNQQPKLIYSRNLVWHLTLTLNPCNLFSYVLFSFPFFCVMVLASSSCRRLCSLGKFTAIRDNNLHSWSQWMPLIEDNTLLGF